MAASTTRMSYFDTTFKNRLRQEVFIRLYRIFGASTQYRCFSAESSSSDDEKEITSLTKPITKRDEKLKNRLSTLLSSIKVEPSIPLENSTITITTKLAKPFNRRQNVKKINQQEQVKEQLMSDESTKIDDKLIIAVKAVASSLPGDKQTIESELLQTLKSHAEETEEAKSVSSEDVSKMFEGMKIERKKQKKMMPSHTAIDHPRHQYEKLQEITIDDTLARNQLQQRTSFSAKNKVNLYISPTLDIFNTPMEDIKTDYPKTKIWNKLAEYELQLLVKHPVRNGFEEMIRWTEERKVWVFPIDNECGLEEKNISFHEHVFLDHLMEGFPTKGPIRHFMELVITGLSKNPYITVTRKKEHVEWYRAYFKDKEKLLKDAGALVN